MTSINDDRLTWFENVAGDGSTWSLRPIALPDALSVAVGDMDRDGDLDVIYGTNVRVGWYENLGGAATWADHLIGTGSAAPTLAVGDLDGDADLDVVGGGRWYRNVAGNGTVWTREELLDSARSRRVIYEHQVEDAGTQTVRLYGENTAIVTARLYIKGVRLGEPIEFRLWFSDTYVRTPQGWRYAFGQASTALPAGR